MTVFAWFMLCMVIRRIVLVTLSAIIGFHRPFEPGTRAPEDRMLKAKDTQATMDDVPAVSFTKDIRINRAIHNDAENDPLFFSLLLATAVASDNVTEPSTRVIVYGSIYLFARMAHAFTYTMALQPWRTIALFVSVLCTLACSLDLVVSMSLRAN